MKKIKNILKTNSIILLLLLLSSCSINDSNNNLNVEDGSSFKQESKTLKGSEVLIEVNDKKIDDNIYLTEDNKTPEEKEKNDKIAIDEKDNIKLNLEDESDKTDEIEIVDQTNTDPIVEPKEIERSGEYNNKKSDKKIEKENTSDKKQAQEGNKKQAVKENSAEKEKKLVPSSIYLGDEYVTYLDIGIDNYNASRVQRYVDDYYVISTVTKFDGNDSEITYFTGHTGAFFGVANLKVGKMVTVTDKNQSAFNYKIIDMKKYPAGIVEENAPFVAGHHLSELAGEGIGIESIVIQYCDKDDVPMIFFAIKE